MFLVYGRLFKELSVSLMKEDFVLETKAIKDKNKLCKHEGR